MANGTWDAHSGLKENHERNALVTDQPIAALIMDLKQRGLLQDTLLVCGGEFGRTHDTNDKNSDGRDHNHRGWTTWLAGGGVKGGMAYGMTDELGAAAIAGGRVSTRKAAVASAWLPAW